MTSYLINHFRFVPKIFGGNVFWFAFCNSITKFKLKQLFPSGALVNQAVLCILYCILNSCLEERDPLHECLRRRDGGGRGKHDESVRVALAKSSQLREQFLQRRRLGALRPQTRLQSATPSCHGCLIASQRSFLWLWSATSWDACKRKCWRGQDCAFNTW